MSMHKFASNWSSMFVRKESAAGECPDVARHALCFVSPGSSRQSRSPDAIDISLHVLSTGLVFSLPVRSIHE